MHSIAIELEFVKRVRAVWCLLNELGQLRFDPGRWRSEFSPSAGRGRGRARGGGASGFRHSDRLAEARSLVGAMHLASIPLPSPPCRRRADNFLAQGSRTVADEPTRMGVLSFERDSPNDRPPVTRVSPHYGGGVSVTVKTSHTVFLAKPQKFGNLAKTQFAFLLKLARYHQNILPTLVNNVHRFVNYIV